ncbi:Oidioi.mRNA.OKI2018_I69.PAR.g12059.t1.cds [Oikopleura dioica]|uniref:chitinase n=1 Tax=Oikopleura dioica TaxID=34765 RepID=A0ABN7S2Y7_OIKDI|nr:Oidioi.mRNA.OKI2018_I69.PAR.g12059.t1.cds [Oikopleura dioica]
MLLLFGACFLTGISGRVQYSSFDNLDGIQVGSKFFYLNAPQGAAASPANFNDAKEVCEMNGGKLAIPQNADEDQAISSYIEEHFLGDASQIRQYDGAWIGIYMLQNGTFMDIDGNQADYVPLDFHSRLVADFDICLSITQGFYFSSSESSYTEAVMWDESFCGRSKMPLCEIDLSTTCKITLVAPAVENLSLLPHEESCEGSSRCFNGTLVVDTCTFPTLYSVNETACVDPREVPECDVNECLDPNACPVNSINCTNEVGTYTCECDAGYEFNDFGWTWNTTAWECSDIDECAEQLDDCSGRSSCNNFDGGFDCICHTGFYYENFTHGECVDYDECHDGIFYDRNVWPAILIGDSQDPMNTSVMADVWEMITACPSFSSCANQLGAYNCTCDDGYMMKMDNFSDYGFMCEDFDECASGDHMCDENAFCDNDSPGYNCTCMIGYIGDGWNCTDVDECADGTDIYECSCNPGFHDAGYCPRGSSDGSDDMFFSTIDHDNCINLYPSLRNFDEAINICQNEGGELLTFDQTNQNDLSMFNAWVFNIAAGLPAWIGYTAPSGANDPSLMTNIYTNEPIASTFNLAPKHPNIWDEACFHMTAIGQWKQSECTKFRPTLCIFDQDLCVDINECLDGSNQCFHQLATCANLDGGYECICADGYEGDGLTTGDNCTDIDECSDATICDAKENSECVNSVGSYDCACKPGFLPLGTECLDFNECLIPGAHDKCDPVNGICDNTIGSYECSCPEFFSGNGTVDDPCVSDLGFCLYDELNIENAVMTDCSTSTDEFESCTGVTCAQGLYLTFDGKDPMNIVSECTCDNHVNCTHTLNKNVACVDCPDNDVITWFGFSTNQIKVSGPTGGLIQSRVEANLAVTSDWSTYTVLLVFPGDLTDARIFTWVFDVANVILEADGSSTMVVLNQNANSPSLTDAWSEFFVGLDNVASIVDSDDLTTFKVGVMPGSIANPDCVLDTNADMPSESSSRIKQRKERKYARRNNA